MNGWFEMAKIRSFSAGACAILILGVVWSGGVCSVEQEYDKQFSEVAEKIEVEHDDFKKLTTYRGPEVAGYSSGLLFIRAWKPDEPKEKAYYQIYVSETYTGYSGDSGNWHSYEIANDDSGVALELKPIDRDVSCRRTDRRFKATCTYEEHVGLMVNRAYLEKNSEKGARIKISGRGGELVVSLPPYYIKAFVSSVPKDLEIMKTIETEILNDKKTDSRTPIQRYEGSFISARSLCLVANRFAQTVADRNEKNLPVDPNVVKGSDVSSCIKDQLKLMEVEYKKFMALQKTKISKEALTEHYVSAVLAVKGISPNVGEEVDIYNKRQVDNRRVAEEKWVKYELVK